MSYFSFDLNPQSHKCAVIGCHGVGSVIAHALMQSGLINALVLIDEDIRISDGLAADLCGALPLHGTTDVWAGEYADLVGCDLIVLAIGVVPLYENAQAELVEINTPLIRKAVSSILAYNTNAVLIVASQPQEIMTYMTLRYSGLPQNRVIAPGTLPYAWRLCDLIAKYLNADPTQIRTMILGPANEHATVCWSQTQIFGMALPFYLEATGRSSDALILHSLFEDVQYAHRRAENAFGCAVNSMANAVLLIARAILLNTNTLHAVCTMADAYCEMSHVCMSVPCLLGKGGAFVFPEILPAPPELDHLQKSAAAMRAKLLYAEQLFV